MSHVLLNMDFIGLWGAGGGSNCSTQGSWKILVILVLMLVLGYFDMEIVEVIFSVK